MPAGGLISVSYNEYFQVPGVTLAGISWTPGARGLQDTVGPKTGSFSVTLPTSPNPYAATSGGRIASYFDDYYNRIHTVPVKLDFGAIVTESTLLLRVWNAYVSQSVTLNSMTFANPAGLAVSGASFPSTFLPLQDRTFNIVASVNGPVSADTGLLLDFAAHSDITLPVYGKRGKLFSFAPAWPPSGRSYQVTYAFQTEIITSRSGREQRIALRDSPRKTVSFQSQLTGLQFNRFNELMWSWQDRSFALPDASRSAKTTVNLSPGDTLVPVDSLPVWAEPGALVAVGDALTPTITTIEAIDGLVIEIRSAIASEMPEGSYVRPVFSGNVASSIAANRDTNAVAKADVRFDVAPLSELPYTPPAAPLSFNGREVFLRKPNWAERVNVTHEHDVDVLDFGRGPVTRYSAIAFGQITKRGAFLGRNRDEAQLILDLFIRGRGRQGEFYMPTWENDLPLKDTVPSGSSALTVAGPYIADAFAGSTVMRAVYVQLTSGEVLLRKVSSIAPVSGSGVIDSVVTVTSPWGVELSSANVVQIGWMPVWRFSSDNLTVEWLTDSVANILITATSLEDLAVETP